MPATRDIEFALLDTSRSAPHLGLTAGHATPFKGSHARPVGQEVVWDGLAKQGLTAREVELVMGGNLARLYREVVG